ncbi:MAG TPA: hypothetical protein VJ783_12850 [Pirellulales bacterium]|nr:hypothetical protein [Pirellulales bacterium]
MEPLSTAGQESSEPAALARGGWRPQFGLRWLLALTAWVAAIMALVVSSLNSLVMSAVGFSLAALNCAGKLTMFQSAANHRRAVGLAWLLLLASLGLPAVRGCGNDAVPGYSAAAVACNYQVRPPVDQPIETWAAAYVEFTWLNLANLLLILSPLFIRRVERGQGRHYGALLALACAVMWCLPIGERPGTLLIGYYVWCLAGLCLLASIRLRWPTLLAMAVLPLAKWFLMGR